MEAPSYQQHNNNSDSVTRFCQIVHLTESSTLRGLSPGWQFLPDRRCSTNDRSMNCTEVPGPPRWRWVGPPVSALGRELSRSSSEHQRHYYGAGELASADEQVHVNDVVEVSENNQRQETSQRHPVLAQVRLDHVLNTLLALMIQKQTRQHQNAM